MAGVCPSVCPSVCPVPPKPRTERPRKPKFERKEAHDMTGIQFIGQRVKVQGHQHRHTVMAEPGGHTSCCTGPQLYERCLYYVERAGRCHPHTNVGRVGNHLRLCFPPLHNRAEIMGSL